MRADLACVIRISRASITQVVGLLDLTPEVVEALATLGDLLPKPAIAERGLRLLLRPPPRERIASNGQPVDVTSIQPDDPARPEGSNYRPGVAPGSSLRQEP